MTLATHATVGALIGAVASQNIVLAATAAFMSHFILDTIPHWDYKLSSWSEDKANPMNNSMSTKGFNFIKDLAKIGLDFTLGLVIAHAVFQGAAEGVLFGAIIGALFGMLPDPLQFVYIKTKMQPFVWIQRFHMFMHAKTRLNEQPVLGIMSQLLLIGVTVLASTYIFNL